MNLYMPVKLYTGVNSLKNNPKELSLGNKCLIITGKSGAKRSGALDDVIDALKSSNIDYEIFDQIEENPSNKTSIEAGKKAYAFGADFLIGIGGGSALDATKAICVFASNPDISEEDFYSKNWPCNPLPFILVGTTAGTGSEVTKVAVMTDSKKRKHSIKDDCMYAKVAFGDPRYTSSMPFNTTISTAIDALAHCVESYFANSANDYSKLYALKGINELFDPLLNIKENDISLETRERLYQGSISGGLAINVTGTAFPHNCGYYLTEEFSVPHGFACAIFMHDLLKYELEHNSEYTKDFFKKCGRSIDDFKELLDKLVPDFNIHYSYDHLQSILPRWENNSSVKNTYGSVTIEDIEKILKDRFC